MKHRAPSPQYTDQSAPSSRPMAVGPPAAVLTAAAAVAAAAWLLVPVGGQPVRLVGWALGSLLTITLVTIYTASDARRSQSTLYAAKPGMTRLRSLIVVAGVVAAAVHAFAFATKVAS